MGSKTGNLVHKKTPRMALDLVETGNDDENSHGKNERVSKVLPSQVQSKMLYKDIIRIAWPSLMELALAQLVSMADMMMVGKLGPWAITAVGLTMQPKFLMMAMFISMNVGATALVARYKGAGEAKKANKILRQALLLTFVLSAIGSICGFTFARPLIQFMGAADANALNGGTVYLKIQMAGFVVMALTSTVTATLRGIGNSRTAMVYNITANIVNVIFNWLLIQGNLGFPKMGIAGASLATVIGQCVAFALAMTVVLRGRQYLHLKLKEGFMPDWESVKSIFNIGIPAMIEQLVMRTGMIIYSKTVASLGTVAFATHMVCLNILSLSFMLGMAVAVSSTSLVGQSLGKKRPDMAQAYSIRARRIGVVVAIVLGAVFILFGKQIITLYNDEPSIVAKGAKILVLMAFVQPFQTSQFILAGALRGAGDTRATAVISVITIMIIRPSLAILGVKVLNWGLEGAWYALITDQLLRSFLVLLRYNSGKWKSIKV